MHALPALAVTITLQLGSVQWPGLDARRIEAHFNWDDDNRLRLALSVGELTAGGRTYPAVRFNCGEARWVEQSLSCRGAVLALAGREDKPALSEVKRPLLNNINIDYRIDTGDLRIDASGADFAGGKADIRVTGNAANWQATLAARAVQAAALRPLLEALPQWPEGYSDIAGTLDVNGEFSIRAGRLLAAKMDADSKALAFTGPAIADNADLHLEMRMTEEAGVARIEGSAALNAGAVYFEPGLRVADYKPGITLEVAGQPIVVNVHTRFDRKAGILGLDEVQIDQPQVASLRITGAMALAADAATEPLAVELRHIDMQQFYSLHVKPHCAYLPALCGLEFDGSMQGSLTWSGEGIADLNLRFDEVHADDDRGRFRISALGGDLVLSSGEREITSALRWQSAGWQRLQFGGGSVSMSSRARALKVTQWSDVDVLGGTFKVDRLELVNVGRRDFSIAMNGVLTPIPMQDFCQAMGWPIMAGTLSGVIPDLTYHAGLLKLDGDLLVRIFGGNVIVRGLTVADPLGQSPVLTTDMDVRAIDLEQLTGAFSFGKIEGSIEGEVKNLRLENWRPTAFDAYLQTPLDDDRRHRISQKAVDNLSAIGGGLGGALSRGFLRIFQDYSYDRLGLHCRLADGVCAMRGVAPAKDGFYIVSRGGLLPPWIDVKGSGRPLPDGRFGIAWDDILLGLNRINSGQMQLQ